MTHQIWDDGEMLSKLPKDTKFEAVFEKIGETPGYRVYAIVNGSRQDRGWVNGLRVKSEQEAITVTRRDVCK
jgi:hypothetical protein